MSAPAPELSRQQMEEARAVRARFLELMPEGLPFIDSLVRDGLIRGWRDVKWVGTPAEGAERHATYWAPRSLSLAQFRKLDELINFYRGEL